MEIPPLLQQHFLTRHAILKEVTCLRWDGLRDESFCEVLHGHGQATSGINPQLT